MSHYNTLHSAANLLLNNAKNSAKTRLERGRIKAGICTITLEDLKKLWLTQNGSYLDKEWTISIERINIKRGYMKDNVCLICLIWNGIDHSIKFDSNQYGCGGWNRSKFLYALAHIKYKYDLITKEQLDQDIIEANVPPTISRTGLYKQIYTRKYTYKRRLRILFKSHINYMNIIKKYSAIILITSPSQNQMITYVNYSESHKKFKNLLNYINQKLKQKEKYSLLNSESSQFPLDDFKIEILISCKNDSVKYFENLYIQEYNTVQPNGLNKAISNRPNHTDKTRKKISESLIDKTKRFDHNNQELPKYIKYVKWIDREGYSITSHPKCKKKDFVSKKKSLDQLYDECVAFLEELNKPEDE
jgi:hypothetical protein